MGNGVKCKYNRFWQTIYAAHDYKTILETALKENEIPQLAH